VNSALRARRHFAATVAIASPLLFAGPAVVGSPAPGDAPPHPELVRMASGLRRLGYAVREVQPGTGDTVLVLSDVHDAAVTGTTLAGLAGLRMVYAWDVVGFENYDHDFRNRHDARGRSGPANAALERMLDAVSPEVTAWAKDRLRRRGTSSGEEVLRYRAGHFANTFGIERGDSSMLFLRVAFVHGELLADLERAWSDSVHVLPDSLRTRALAALGGFLTAADPACPRAPVAARSPEALASLRRRLGAYSAWINRYVLDDRNRGFAESVARELRARGATRAVMLVGYAHTAHGSAWPSVQERLRESGATVIVADPPAVRTWLEKHAPMTGLRP